MNLIFIFKINLKYELNLVKSPIFYRLFLINLNPSIPTISFFKIY